MLCFRVLLSQSCWQLTLYNKIENDAAADNKVSILKSRVSYFSLQKIRGNIHSLNEKLIYKI